LNTIAREVAYYLTVDGTGHILGVVFEILGCGAQFSFSGSVAFERDGKLEEAERLHQDALARLEASVGTNHPWVSETLCNFGLLKGRKGELAAAEAMQRN